MKESGKELSKDIDPVRTWSQMKTLLDPNDIKGNEKLLRGYTRAQVRLANNQKTKARRIFDSLIGNSCYIKLEETRKGVLMLRTIDLAVRGESNWNPDDLD